MYDEKWARREDYGLADVFGYSYKEGDRPERVENNFGKGRAILYPGPVELLIEKEPNGYLAQKVLSDIRSGIKNPIVEVHAPMGLVVNVTQAEAGQVVHVLNYGCESGSMKNIEIRLASPQGEIVTVIPFGGKKYRIEGDVSEGLTFTLAEVKIYTACLVNDN